VNRDSAVLKSFTDDDIRISKSNKITWIHQLCSLEANYKSQGTPKLWVSDISHPNF